MTKRAADLARVDATTLLRALATRQLTAAGLLEASVAAAAEAPALNAVIRRDLENARRAAKALDERRAGGETAEALGLLAGLPMTIKDTFDVDGMAATAGCRRYQERGAGDAAPVGRIRTEGAVIWGKTNTPEMAGDFQTANRIYGTTTNPWDEARTPGGSSGAAAAAVAQGITALEIGSDMSGSLRVPASFCGVFAHKPTYGLVAQRGHIPPEPGAAAELDLNVIGPIARSARDLRLLLSIIAQAPVPAKATPVALPDVKVGLWLEEPEFVLDPEVRAVIAGFVKKLQAAGAQVEAIKSPVNAKALMDAFCVLLFSSSGSGFAPAWLRPLAKLARLLGAGPRSWAGVILARSVRHRVWMVANETRARMELSLRKAFAKYDVILCPAVGVTAFPHRKGRGKLRLSSGKRAAYGSLMEWSALASACGLPATVVPAGRTPGGLPVGVQLIGPRGGDSKTLAVAQAIDETIGGFVPPGAD